MLVWTSMETLICSYPLASSGIMAVKHFITLFCILSFMIFLKNFNAYVLIFYGTCRHGTREAYRDSSRGTEGSIGHQRAGLGSPG